jgi:hypothetical protein
VAVDLVVNRVPLAVRNAILRRPGCGKLVLLHELDHPDGYVRAWSGSGPLTYAGQIWYGLGDLVSITGLGGSRETKVRAPVLTLAGVRADQLKFVTAKVRGRRARVSLAALRRGTKRVDGEPYQLCYATCDLQEHKITRSRGATIEITLNQPLFILDRSPNLSWTPDWLKATYGDDIVGLDDLPGVAQREESWAPA